MTWDDADFSITSDNILLPFNVYVSRESKEDLLPPTRDITEEIPGRHGEFDFGTEFKARTRELVCRTEDGLTAEEIEELKRMLAYYLDPTKGVKTLAFEDVPDRYYKVKFSGKITPDPFAGWFEFTIPFKMSDPFIFGLEEKTLAGSGEITNSGNWETPVLIEIAGPATNPVFEIDDTPHIFVGTINEGETVIIDTGTATAKNGTTNVFSGFSAAFASGNIALASGVTTVSATSNVTFRWYDRWI